MSQQVITAKEAREITGGRMPLVPVEYETAINALTACLTLDEAKIWADKSDALAAWAKIYHSKDAERKAAQLKLHAYKRMGEIALELKKRKEVKQKAPKTHREQVDQFFEPRGEAAEVLRENGLPARNARAALVLAEAGNELIQKMETEQEVPTPIQAADKILPPVSSTPERDRIMAALERAYRAALEASVKCKPDVLKDIVSREHWERALRRLDDIRRHLNDAERELLEAAPGANRWSSVAGPMTQFVACLRANQATSAAAYFHGNTERVRQDLVLIRAWVAEFEEHLGRKS